MCCVVLSELSGVVLSCFTLPCVVLCICCAEGVERCCIELFHAAMCCVVLSELSGVVLSCFTLPCVVLC